MKAARLNREMKSSNLNGTKRKQNIAGSSEATQELHQDVETASKRKEMEQIDAAPGQPTTQEGSVEAMLEKGSELQSNHPTASNETHQQPNTVVQGKKIGEAKKTAAGNQKEETPTVYLF